MCSAQHINPWAKFASAIKGPNNKLEWPRSPNCSNWGDLSMIDPKFEQLRDWWRSQFEDMMVPAPEILPPFQEYNHKINIINATVNYTKRRLTRPQALEEQLHKKLARYEWASWWVQRPVPHACPLLCIAKKRRFP